MASLIGDVFIVKESAIDYLLDNFKTWPGPHDSINYTKWSHIINMCLHTYSHWSTTYV